MPHLDKYGPYVLAAYGIAIVVLVGIVALTLFRIWQAKKKLDALEASEGAKPEAKP